MMVMEQGAGDFRPPYRNELACWRLFSTTSFGLLRGMLNIQTPLPRVLYMQHK